MNSLPRPSPHRAPPPTSTEKASKPASELPWQGEELTPEERHKIVTDGQNDLTSAQRAAIANQGLELLKQSAEQAVAPPVAMPAAPALAPPGVGIWDLGAVLTGVLAGGALGGVGVLFGAQGHPEMADLLAETVIPASAVVGAAVAALLYRNCPC